MSSPADICEQWERNLPFSSADVRGAGTRDEPLRTSACEASRRDFPARLLIFSAPFFLEYSLGV